MTVDRAAGSFTATKNHPEDSCGMQYFVNVLMDNVCGQG